ncbi:N-acetyltransferase [Brachybacterium sp. YJGR34]|uniref:GNAT family N-acetyltransferase n=1 Tax=Brachybacterium sp. YJGR34 TaxID=2059911 RepID=UPI000E0CA5E1|nr:GNAT family N-acetyltransferase [Brachybacterium sp. YJGR34]
MTRRSRRTSPAAPRPLSPSRRLEALIAGWRPLQRLDIDGFAVLRSRGVTRRAHSVVALEAPEDRDALEAALERVESLVRAAGEAPVHRIVEGVSPTGLDPLLRERGEAMRGRSEIWELPLAGTAAAAPPAATARIAVGALDPDWFESAWHLAPRPGEGARETLRDICAGTPAIQVSLPAEGTDAAGAVGRAALVEAGREQVAVLNLLAVDPAHRRRGLGRDLTRSLLALAAMQGAQRALLEVESENTAAKGLYRALGARRVGTYHYRVASDG